MNNSFRPQRDFTIEAKSQAKPQQLDEIVQGTIEGKLAEHIQNDATIQYALENADTENGKIEAEMMINGAARRLLKEAHDSDRSTHPDMSNNHDLVREISANALEIVNEFQTAEINRQGGLLSRNDVIPAPVEEGEECAL